MPPGTRKEKLIAFCRLTWISESLARYCLQTFLNKNDLWIYFENDSDIDEFWKRTAEDRKGIWGNPLELGTVEGLFSPQLAEAVIE
jgi:hypothetical protein